MNSPQDTARLGAPMFPRTDHKYANGTEYGSPGETVQVYAAIHLKVPQSGIPALDDMIRESRRLDFIAATLTGDRADSTMDQTNSRYAELAVTQANELVALKGTFGEGGDR